MVRDGNGIGQAPANVNRVWRHRQRQPHVGHRPINRGDHRDGAVGRIHVSLRRSDGGGAYQGGGVAPLSKDGWRGNHRHDHRRSRAGIHRPETSDDISGIRNQASLGRTGGEQRHPRGQGIGEGHGGSRVRPTVHDSEGISQRSARHAWVRCGDASHLQVGELVDRSNHAQRQAPAVGNGAGIAAGVVEHVERPVAVGIHAVKSG